MNYRSHPLFFGGGPDIPAGLSADDRAGLLEKEDMLAQERDARAREFQMEMERQRQAQQREMEKLSKVQEAERVKDIEKLERQAAEYAPTEANVASQDRERRRSQMWGALGAGQEQATNTETPRPE